MPVEEWINEYVFVMHDFLSLSECRSFIQISEEFGYEDALVSSQDGQVLRKDIRNNERVIFLNDDFEGGETSFEDSYSDESFDEFKVVPHQGMALFFQHEVHHKGERVLSGRKYVLRSDIMYSAADDEPGFGPEDDSDDFDD